MLSLIFLQHRVVATEYIQELQLFPSVENKLPVKKKKDSQWDHIRFIPMTYIHLPKTSQNVDNPVKCFQPLYIILRTSTCLQDSSSVISNVTHSNYKSLSLRADNVSIPAVVNVRGRVLV